MHYISDDSLSSQFSILVHLILLFLLFLEPTIIEYAVVCQPILIMSSHNNLVYDDPRDDLFSDNEELLLGYGSRCQIAPLKCQYPL